MKNRLWRENQNDLDTFLSETWIIGGQGIVFGVLSHRSYLGRGAVCPELFFVRKKIGLLPEIKKNLENNG